MKYLKDENTNEVYAYDQEQIDGGWVKDKGDKNVISK